MDLFIDNSFFEGWDPQFTVRKGIVIVTSTKTLIKFFINFIIL